MTTAPPVPASRGPAAKPSASPGRTNSSSSTDLPSTVASEAPGGDGGPINSFLTILQSVIMAASITTKTTRSSDEESLPSRNGTGADVEDPTAPDEGDAANVLATAAVPTEISLSVVATLPATNGLHAGEALADQPLPGKIPSVSSMAAEPLATSVANGPSIPIAEAGAQNQGPAASVSVPAGESTSAVDPVDPSRTTTNEEADELKSTLGSTRGSAVGGAATGRSASFGPQGSAEDSSRPSRGPAPVGIGQANVLSDPLTQVEGSVSEGASRTFETRFTFGETLYSPTAFGPNGSLSARGVGSPPTELTTADATAPGNAGTTGLAPSSTAWTAVGSTPAAPVLQDLPPGHFGAPPEVARAVPSQILPLLDRLPQNGAALVLRLDPPTLGTVVLRVVAGEGRRVRLHFQVEDSAVGNALADGWDQLEAALRAQGLLPEGFTVDLNSAHHPNGRSDQGASSPGHDASPSGRRVAALPTLDQSLADAEVVDMRGSGRYIDYRL